MRFPRPTFGKSAKAVEYNVAMSGRHFPQELLRFVEQPRRCSYLPQQTASLEYRLYSELSPAELEHLLQRGWRRFSTMLFRPTCAECSECISLRVPVNQFRPSKSQRRTLKKNAHVSISIGPPAVTEEHLRLYNTWHQDMTLRRNWPLQQADFNSYSEGFLLGDFPSLREMQYRDGDRLIGIGLVDVLPHSLSSAYFYHDPAWRPLGPGTFSGLCEIEYASQLGLEFLYLGYWIQDCPSMSYKNRFRPNETLVGRPGDRQRPGWRRMNEVEDGGDSG